MVGIGGWGIGKSGISPNEEASDAAEDVVKGRDDLPDVGEKTSSLWYDARYCPGEVGWSESSSGAGRGGRWGGGPRFDPGGFCTGPESLSSASFGKGH